MITAADLMTKDVLSVTPDASAAEVAQLILKHRISALPVVDAEKRLLGMVSEGDLVRSAETNHEANRSRWLIMLTKPAAGVSGMRYDANRQVEDVMSRDILMATERETLPRLIDLLSTSRIKRLPVVKDDRLVGIVSRVDVLKFLAKTFSRTEMMLARKQSPEVSGQVVAS